MRGGLGVSITVGIDNALVHGQVTLVRVHMTREVNVDAVLVKQVFHRCLELCVDGVTLEKVKQIKI